jgi:lipopolysaccharide/colanic/teichoic acid biosynthesis glycosyltransferase
MIRSFDIIFCLIGLIILSPLLILILLCSFLDSGSPIFIQKRVGQNCKSFFLIKFRTMPVNTKSVGTHLLQNKKLSTLASFLRKKKLDEILQLFNVVIGDMSLVGPRPCLLCQSKLIFERKKRQVFKVKPGITGLAQIKGITMKTPTLLAKTDLHMIKGMSLYNYFYYIFATLLLFFKN